MELVSRVAVTRAVFDGENFLVEADSFALGRIGEGSKLMDSLNPSNGDIFLEWWIPSVNHREFSGDSGNKETIKYWVRSQGAARISVYVSGFYMRQDDSYLEFPAVWPESK